MFFFIVADFGIYLSLIKIISHLLSQYTGIDDDGDDVLCPQREELVLLLIQLRRSQTQLEQMRVWVREKLAHRRPDEKAYRIQSAVLSFCLVL